MTSKNGQAAAEKAASFSLFDFIGSVKAELGKVTWTTQDELKVYTKVVVSATFASGIVLYLMDVLIQRTLTGLDALMRLITG